MARSSSSSFKKDKNDSTGGSESSVGRGITYAAAAGTCGAMASVCGKVSSLKPLCW